MIRQSSVYIRVLIFSLFLVGACSQNESAQNASGKTETEPASVNSDTNRIVLHDTAQLSKTELTSLYSRAINDFMQVMYQKDALVFDTLFLGDRKLGTKDDFPELDLPEKIGSTRIVLVSVGKAHGAYKSRFKKTSPFINLMGWANRTDAEFIFITFYPEFSHQYDCYLNYIYHPVKKDYELSEQRLEVLMGNPSNKTPHFAIYKAGKYIGDKAVN